MPKDAGAGFSGATPIKLAQLDYIVRTWVGLTAGPKFRRARGAHPEFLYWDLNAGPGIVNGEPGSPLVALDALAGSGEPFRAWFHERTEDGCARLTSAVGSEWDGRVLCVPGDHNLTVAETLKRDSWRIRSCAYGLAFADPNGRDDLPIGPLQTIARRFPRVDFLVNLSAMSWKRIRSVGKPGRFLHEDLAQVPKEHTLIRAPVGPWQWAMFLFTNYASAPELKRLGFRNITSAEGQAILRKLDLLPVEYYQSPLFDIEALRRTGPMLSISSTRSTERSAPMPSLDVVESANAAAVNE